MNKIHDADDDDDVPLTIRLDDDDDNDDDDAILFIDRYFCLRHKIKNTERKIEYNYSCQLLCITVLSLTSLSTSLN